MIRIIAFALSYIIISAISFYSAWSWKSAISNYELLEQMNAVNDANIAAIEAEKKVIAEKEKNYYSKRQIEIAKNQEAKENEQQKTEIRVKYVSEDINANNCGFSSAGVYVWNTSASCDSLPETDTSRSINYGGPITARNSEIARAAQISFSRHCSAIRQINELKTYIREKCI
jgi:hypothetical protein